MYGGRFSAATLHNTSSSEGKQKKKRLSSFKSNENIHKKEEKKMGPVRNNSPSMSHWPVSYTDEIKINEYSNTREDKQKQWVIKIIINAYFCLFSASNVIMSYGKLITRFTTGGHDIFITCSAKSMHLEPGACFLRDRSFPG